MKYSSDFLIEGLQ